MTGKKSVLIASAFVAVALVTGVVLLKPSSAESGSVVFDGFEWVPLGQASLAITSEGLVVSSIGSSGLDGVRQLVPTTYVPGATDPFHRIVDGGLKTSGTPAGAFFKWQKRGSLAGTPDQVRETCMVTIGTSGATYSYDVSPLVPTSVTVEHYLAGNHVSSEINLPATADSLTCMRTPDDWAIGFTWDPEVPCAFPSFQPGTIQTDEVVVVPQGSTVSQGAVSAIDWIGSQTGTFTIRALE